jgi:putative ribosome biogenesis GTPase RsgA
MREPGCAVSAAAASGALDARRYESYRRLRRLREELTAARGPKRSR